MINTLSHCIIHLLIASLSAKALSAELVYRPVNPNFGGRALNGSLLLNSAQAQNDFEDPDRPRRDDSLQAEFTRTLQSRLLSSLAGQVADSIFGASAQDSGTIVFDNQSITFNRGLEVTTVEILDTASGSTTVIEIPTLQVE